MCKKKIEPIEPIFEVNHKGESLAPKTQLAIGRHSVGIILKS